MKPMIKALLIFSLITFCISYTASAQQTKYLPVHFLYGSRPLQKYKFMEKKWFGGKMGGHVGIEIDSNKIINFVHHGNFHLISNKQNKHSSYVLSTPTRFNTILGGDSGKVKTLTIFIPVNQRQKEMLDSISGVYLIRSPYDYALFGMRCGAACYEVLAQIGILPQFSNSKTALKVFYPKILRKQLLSKAAENGWQMVRHDGTERRSWETD
jgi:hypothetical protein